MSSLPPALELEHLDLISRLALFRDQVLNRAPEHQLRSSMNEVHDALVTHFRIEQDAMQSLRYGGLWKHRDEHFVIWHSMLRHMEVCEKSTFSVQCGLDLYRSMLRMLERHVESFDKDFLTFASHVTQK